MNDDPLPRVLAERYRLDAELGRGGMGVVYRGFDLVIERPVAIKLLREWGRESADAARLLREMRATAKVKSPHSVTLLDVGMTPAGDPFLVMSLVPGESLDALLKRESTLPVVEAVSIGLQVCDALTAAHAVGIVHRDVKPANIMVSGASAGRHATVLDFGIARHVDQATLLTAAASFVGTLEYVAPEQVAGEALDGRADQYALAVTMLRMIAGGPLFPDTDMASLIHHKLLRVPASLRERVPGAPIALDRVLSQALETTPAARFPDMSAFAAALRSAVSTADRAAPTSASVQAASAPLAAQHVSRSPSSQMDFEGDAGLEIALAPGAGPSPAPRAAERPLVPIASTLVSEHEGRDAALTWLAPGVWKRVLAYSALALLLGNACVRGFSTTATVVLALGVVLGGSALVLHAWLSRA